MNSLASNVRAQLMSRLESAGSDEVALMSSLSLLASWRSLLIQNTLIAQCGTTVMQGPLAGLDFLPRSAEGCHIAKVLGCYEQPLQPYIEAAMSEGYATLLNIGCAEGYYAVGMARRMPRTRVLAFDLNPKAQEACAALAVKNGVSDRVQVGGLFRAEDFALYASRPGRRTLLFCDIEGAERELLDPSLAPDLAGIDVIMESHECLLPGITQMLIDRFKGTHTITVVQDDGQRRLLDAPDWFKGLAHLDQLLASWEWRAGPTPWLVMRSSRSPTI